MIEEQQQADILEEHIPKISDNIFLVHQNKVPQKFHSTYAPKTATPELLPTATVTLSVDNVVIIEKENKESSDEIISTSTQDSVLGVNEEQKEYPKAGIVHRLLGRFQVEKFASPSLKNTQFDAPLYQNLKTTEAVKPCNPYPITPPPTPHITPVEEKPDLDIASAESHPLTADTMPSDLISPLLMSSAKPFSRQDMTNARGEHGFHHVNVPIRRVTAPTSLKYKAPPALEAASPEKADPKSTLSSFPEDLSSLHSATETPATSSAQETIVIETQTNAPEETSVPNSGSLNNGETLHSSGSRPQRPPISPRRPIKLQDKSNFSAYRSTATDDHQKLEEKAQKTANVEPPKKESHVIPKRPEIITPEAKSEVKIRPSQMKENRIGYTSNVKRHDHSESQFKQVVNESFDESTLNSQAAVAANHIMKTSKTFKITPSRQKQQSLPPALTTKATSVDAPKADTAPTIPDRRKMKSAPILAPCSTTPVPKLMPPIPPRRHEVEKAETTVPQARQESQPPTETWPPAKSLENLPSTSIDDVINSPEIVAITPISSLPASSATEKEDRKEPVTKPLPTRVPEIRKEEKPRNFFSGRTSSNTISVVPKSEPIQTQSIFGPKVAKSSSSSTRGKSFTIDPSRFKKSSAQPPVASSASSTIQTGGNTRIIVPGTRNLDLTETESAGDTPKTGKRKLTVDQIKVIGGYVTLEKSCLVKENKRKKGMALTFSEKDLETTYTYVSERSLTEEATPPVEVKKSPGFAKDSTIGKYTPKYLLSMKATEIPDDEENSNESRTQSMSTRNGIDSNASTPNEVAPLPEDPAASWSDTTRNSNDVLF